MKRAKRIGYVRVTALVLTAFGIAALISLRIGDAKQFRESQTTTAPSRPMDRDGAAHDALFYSPRDKSAGQHPNAVAATFTVTRSDDIAPRGTCAVGDCTLREAVIAANNTAGADTITFSAALNGVPITLTRAATLSEDFAADGDLDISESVTITGNGTGNTVIRGGSVAYGGVDKVFALNPNCSSGGSSIVVSFTDLTISNGHNSDPFNAQFSHTGGAIDYCSGGSGTNSLTMTNVIVRDSQVDNGTGGGLNVVGVSSGTNTVTLTNVQFLNNRTSVSANPTSGGGANISFNTSATTMTVNITGCTFDNNEASNSNGGGLTIISNITAVHTGILNIHNSVFSNNRAKGFGGGIELVGTSAGNGALSATIDQETVIKNNVTGINGGSSLGGGIHIDLLHPNSFLNLSKVTIINNSEDPSSTNKLGGAGLAVGNAAGTGATGGVGVSIQFSRIENNTLTVGTGVGTGLRKDTQVGTVNATNNWWGCSAGPTAAPCDTAVLLPAAGSTLTTAPFLRVKTTPTTNPIIVNQTSLMTARIQDSTGTDTAVANLNVFVNTNATAGSPLGVTWSGVGGTLSGQQTTLQSSGGFAQATATYTGTAALASNSATAKVDNDSTSGATNTASITVNKGNTTASITGQGLTTTLTGQSFTVNFNAVPSNTTNSPTAMSGNVTVSDGVNNCSGAINGSGNGSCSLALDTVGSRNLTATYVGDGNFNASAASPSLAHTVTNVATWIGSTSIDWNTGSNWGTGAVPGSIHDANIPAGAVPNEPTIGAFVVNLMNLTVGSGHTLTVNSGASVTALGTATINGSFAGSGGSFGFVNLTIGNPAGVTLGGNASVSGVLALTSGDLNMGANVLTQPGPGNSTGTFDVTGKVRITNVLAGGCGTPPCANTMRFGNPNNQITITAGPTFGDITVDLAKSAPAGFASAVQRNYTITPNPSNPSPFTATVRLHYLVSELGTNTPETALNLRRFNGVGWAPYPATAVGGVDIVNHSVENNAVHNFSQWTFSKLSPTAVSGVISGRITDSLGNPVEGAMVRLSGGRSRKLITDANGDYSFDNVDPGGFYTVTPSRANFNFNPFNRSFSQVGNKTEAAFTGTSMGDNANPLDTPEYFVRQEYIDILGREPDEGGFNFWSDKINQCLSAAAAGLSEPPAVAGGSANAADCLSTQRINVAAAFFMAEEFQQTGSYLYDVYAGALGRKPAYAEYAADRQQIIGGAALEAEKVAFAQTFVQRSEFRAKYQNALTAEAFVEALLQSVQATGVNLNGERDTLTSAYNAGTDLNQSRAAVLRAVADNPAFKQAQFNQAFVLTEYFGYLRRDPDRGGNDFWLNVLNTGGDYRGLVCSFITSAEYQNRFSQIVSRSNSDCAQ